MVQYLSMRGGAPGPFFLFSKNKSLTRASFSASLDRILKELHLDPSLFDTHSLKIGAATSAKQARVSDSHLKALGKGKSEICSIITPKIWLGCQVSCFCALWQIIRLVDT